MERPFEDHDVVDEASEESFPAMDLAQGRTPFHTAGLIGSWLFFGGAAPPPPQAWAGPVLAYNGVHLLASLAVGILGAVLVLGSDLHRGFWYFALLVLVAAGMYAFTLLGGIRVEVAGALDWPTVVLGTGAWLGVMTVWFWRAHRWTRQRIRADLDAGGRAPP